MHGVAEANLGRLTEAVSILEGALDHLGLDPHGKVQRRLRRAESVRDHHRALGARILLSLAFPYHELDQLSRAEQALEDAERAATGENRAEIRVLVDAQRGAMLIREGRLTTALAHLDHAVAGLASASPADQCKLLLNRGELHGMLGRLDDAMVDVQRALTVASAHDLTDFAFYATHNLGWLEFLRGNLVRALELMPLPQEAESDLDQAVVGMDRARVLLSAGLAAEADTTLIEASQAFARTELNQFLAQAELARAEVALLADQTKLAARLAADGVARLRGGQNLRSTALGELVQLRIRARQGTQRDQVARQADRLSRTFQQLALPDHEHLARLIAVDCRRGVRGTVPVLPRLRAGQSLDVRLYHRIVRARLAFDRGDAVRGRREARIGLAELAEHQAQFGSLDLQTSSAAHGVALARLAISEEVANGRAGAVLHWLERSRAISTRVPEVRPPADEESAELLGQLRWVMSKIDAQQADGRDSDSLHRRRLELQRTIRARSWTISGSPGGAVKVPSGAAIRGSIGRGTLVAIFLLRDQLRAIVLTSTRCCLRRLGSVTEVEQAARRVSADHDVLAMDLVPAPLRTSATRSLARGLARLDELLLMPLELPAGPVVLLPPGRFAGLPWGRMPSLTGRPVTVAPSAAAWMRAHANVDSAPGQVTAVAGPGLARAEEEVNEVADAWPDCDRLIGPLASGESVLSAMDGGRVVHVAAHGQHQPDSPLFSSIKLFDGPLVGYDLERLRRPPQQVVLSACDLGQATVRPGDEALGLTRALLHSGTPTVISGVAKVSDRGAADLMVDYHRRLAAGSPPAYALADSLAATDEPLPFVCFGAGW